MSATAKLPDKIGRYQILQLVGRGGMGVLYRGFDPVLDREVAVKVMLTDFSVDPEHMRARFYREAKAAAKLQHRNIVTVFEFAEEGNQPYIVMEFLRGQSLADRMNQSPPLALDDKLDIVAQLAAGLGYAHSQGVVHRDVKPANVFILEDGTVKLLDFGIAKLTASTLTQAGDVLGSAHYMSPEQVAGSTAIDGRADVWSTGVLLYELLTGRKPFGGEALTSVIAGILREEPPVIDTVVPGIPKALSACVMRALEKDPDKRTARAEDLARELQLIRKTLQASGTTAPMEETRYASTQVLKALHDDRQRQTRVAADAPTLVVGRETDGAAAAPAAPGPARAKRLLIGGVAAALLVAVAGGAVWRWRGSAGSAGSTGAAAAPATADLATSPASSAPPAGEAARPGGGGPTSPAPAAAPPKVAEKAPAPPPSARPKIEKPTGGTAGSGGAAPASGGPAAPLTRPAPSVMVSVTMSGPYEFEVFDGTRSISPPARTHELAPQFNGKVLRVVNPEYLLDRTVRIEGGEDRTFTYEPPALGVIDIRAVRGDCKVIIDKRDMGYPPVNNKRLVAGDYQVSLSCPDGLNPSRQVTVVAGRPQQVRFTEK